LSELDLEVSPVVGERGCTDEGTPMPGTVPHWIDGKPHHATPARTGARVRFWSRGSVVTSRWPSPDHRGINLGFPQNQEFP
jgi:hypothetical protein